MFTGYGWGMRNNNNSNNNNNNRPEQHNFATTNQSVFATSRIACRFCDKIFMSTQDFIHHIENHMVDNRNSFSGISQYQNEPNPNFLERAENHHSSFPFQPNFPLMTPPPAPVPTPYLNSPVLYERNNHDFHSSPRLATSESIQQSRFLPRATANSFNMGPHMCPHYGSSVEVQGRSNNEPRVTDCTKPLIDQLQKKPVESGIERIYVSENLDLTLKL